MFLTGRRAGVANRRAYVTVTIGGQPGFPDAARARKDQ